MKQIELTSKLVLAIIGLTSVSAILVPTYAVPSIKSADIVNETILSEDIKNGEVKTVDLANEAVTQSKIASGAIQLNVHEAFGNEVELDPGEHGGSSAVCPAGEVVTGGGFTSSSTFGLHLIHSDLVEPDTWSVGARNDSPSVISFAANVMCIDPSIP